MSRNRFAALLAEDFRANGILKATNTNPVYIGPDLDRPNIYEGPVCFYCNNVPANAYNGDEFREVGNTLRSLHGSGSAVHALANLDDSVILSALDAL
jgi:hypothetical protein